MSVPDIDTALRWRGSKVRAEDGDELGRLTELYLDGDSRPAWASVKRGLLGGTETIVPLAGAEEVDGDLRLPHHRRLFDEAPDVDPDVELTEQEESVLLDHWGRGWAPPSGEETDTAMTRSEEEVELGKRTVRRAERVRIKKVLVEDEVTKTVPVRREVIQLETDPLPEGHIESSEYVDEDPRS
ncbi:MAG: DUF2382 domain-containing protein [Solirubrobacterales bacterium]|nr:DUF2382 domain-containing protein [Solirubrobacterales bacterium]